MSTIQPGTNRPFISPRVIDHTDRNEGSLPGIYAGLTPNTTKASTKENELTYSS